MNPEVLRLAQAGYTDAEIAQRTGMHKSTVQTHRRRAGIPSAIPPQVSASYSHGWKEAGLRTSNLPDERIAKLYKGARYA